jgi:hypothetical protein
MERLRLRWEENRERFAAQVAGYNADAAALFEKIEDELQGEKPDLTAYPVPEARPAVEKGDMLFDSTRELGAIEFLQEISKRAPTMNDIRCLAPCQWRTYSLHERPLITRELSRWEKPLVYISRRRLRSSAGPPAATLVLSAAAFAARIRENTRHRIHVRHCV